jgi:8-oxo-dGTP diphosphatase
MTATNDIMEAEGKHYVTIFVGARVVDGKQEAVVCPYDSRFFSYKA